ncbi:hypothetical protein HYX04_02375 [Candidatus Woesearchaeota archaeon]|nr:hypothetical protein [Candidatus Woesearchaeota archaeon]
MMGCSKCMKMGGATFLVLGLAYLAVDLGWWDFWGISWWTALFVVMGIAHLGSANCKDCRAIREGRKK